MPKKQKLTLLDIKFAILNDKRFRDLFPELAEESSKIMNNPSCGCNVPMLRKFLNEKERLQKYFPNKDIITSDEEIEALAQNKWDVINCKIDELEDVLNGLHKVGRKQIAVARFEDKVTVIVNDLGVIF